MLMGVLANLEVATQHAPAGLTPLLQDAAESANRAAELVRKLMTYAGRHRARARTVEDLCMLVRRAVELCRNTFDRRIAFEQSYEEGAHANVDATHVEQAVLNLLINARDALESPCIDAPRVCVSVAIVRGGASELTGRPGDHVRVVVRDNGEGMDAATVQRIYEPFFTTKGVGKGTGLGLATTQAIVHEHRGFIACESAPGRGTAFSVYLPRETPLDERGAPAPQPPPARGSEMVLVVDDERTVRRVVSIMLRSEGYTVREAASGGEALQLLSDPAVASHVALILLDVSMPGLPRRELRSRLRELTDARVVYCSGYALDASDADPDDLVLEKPVAKERLLRTIREALDC
jgi:CheY-like chemotaxis protein